MSNGAVRLFAPRTSSSVNREHIQRLLGEAAKLTNHRDYVIIGSLSVLGAVAAIRKWLEENGVKP